MDDQTTMLTLALAAATLTQPQPEPVCIVDNVTILAFASGSAELSSSARLVLDAWPRTIHSQRFAPEVLLTGQTDRVGSRRANQRLSLSRARAVRDYLVSVGVEGRLIRVSGSGEDRPIIDTADEVPEAQNRVVWLQMLTDVREPRPRCETENSHSAH